MLSFFSPILHPNYAQNPSALASITEIKKGAAFARLNMPAKQGRPPADKGQSQSNLPFNDTALPDFSIARAARYRQLILSEEALHKEKYFSGEALEDDALPALRNLLTNRNGLLVNIKENA